MGAQNTMMMQKSFSRAMLTGTAFICLLSVSVASNLEEGPGLHGMERVTQLRRRMMKVTAFQDASSIPLHRASTLQFPSEISSRRRLTRKGRKATRKATTIFVLN